MPKGSTRRWGREKGLHVTGMGWNFLKREARGAGVELIPLGRHGPRFPHPHFLIRDTCFPFPGGGPVSQRRASLSGVIRDTCFPFGRGAGPATETCFPFGVHQGDVLPFFFESQKVSGRCSKIGRCGGLTGGLEHPQALVLTAGLPVPADPAGPAGTARTDRNCRIHPQPLKPSKPPASAEAVQAA